MNFKNVYYIVKNKTYVGNIMFDNNEIIFETDKKSVNDEYCKIEIPIRDIDKTKLKKCIVSESNFQTIIIEAKNDKYKFQFNFYDEYEKFIKMVENKNLT